MVLENPVSVAGLLAHASMQRGTASTEIRETDVTVPQRSEFEHTATSHATHERV